MMEMRPRGARPVEIHLQDGEHRKFHLPEYGAQTCNLAKLRGRIDSWHWPFINSLQAYAYRVKLVPVTLMCRWKLFPSVVCTLIRKLFQYFIFFPNFKKLDSQFYLPHNSMKKLTLHLFK